MIDVLLALVAWLALLWLAYRLDHLERSQWAREGCAEDEDEEDTEMETTINSVFAARNFSTGTTFVVGEEGKDDEARRQFADDCIAHGRQTIDAIGQDSWNYMYAATFIVRDRMVSAEQWATYIGRLPHAVSSVAALVVNAVYLAAVRDATNPEAIAAAEMIAANEREWQVARAQSN